MKRAFVVYVLFVMAICFVSGQALAQNAWTGNINLFYGLKSIESDDWSIPFENISDEIVILEVSDAKELGISMDFGKKSWPVTIVAGFYMSEGDDSYSYSPDNVTVSSDGVTFYDATFTENEKFEVSTQEFRIGVKKTFKASPTVFPYIMVGLAQIEAEGKASYSYQVEVPDLNVTDSYSESYSESDSVVGFWLGGGIYYQFKNKFNLGVEVSYSSGEVSIDDTDLEAGGVHYGLFVGYHWS